MTLLISLRSKPIARCRDASSAARAGGLPVMAGLLIVSSGLLFILPCFMRRLRGILPAELIPLPNFPDTLVIDSVMRR